MPRPHPLQAIPPAQWLRVFLPLLAMAGVLMVALTAINAPLATAAAPRGMVSFELAGSVAEVRRILASWDETARISAAFSLGLDYVFLALYPTTIALACLRAARPFAAGGSRLAALAPLAVWLAWGQWLAGLLDAIENAALYRVLLGPVTEPWPAVARACALPKFALVLAGLFYAAAGAAVALAARAGRDSRVSD